MNPAAQLLLFADLMLKCTLVLTLALLAARLWRGASAANRHLIWLAAFALLLLLPLTLLFPPRWSWQPARAETPPAAAASSPARPMASFAHAVRVPVAAGVASTSAARPSPPPPTDKPARFTPGTWLLLAWLAGVAVLWARLVVGAGQLWSWRRRSASLFDDRSQALTRRIAGQYELTRAVELRSAAWCRVPMTWGTLHPVVLLPADATTWPEPRLALVLRHELGHIARHDCLARLFAQLAAALYWPNPLVWLALRALRLAQEQACDDLVLAAGTPAKTYALELVAATRLLHGSRHPASAVAMGEPSTLGRRIENIIGEHRDRRPLARRTAVVASVLAGLVLGSLASCRVREMDAKPVQDEPVPNPANADGDPFAAATKVEGPTAVGAQTRAAPATTVQVAIESWFVKIDQGDFEFNELGKYGTANPTAANPDTGATQENNWIGRLDVPVVLRALAGKPGYELLSKPAITVLSGMKTAMVVAKELRYPQSYSDTGAPADFTTRNVGIELAAKPTVASDGHTIDLFLSPRITEFDGFVLYGEKSVQPVFSTQEMTTEVSMQDGATLVLGGLALAEKTNTGEVPKLGGIATLIAGNSDDSKKRMLLVFITARIVRQGEAAKR